MIGEANGRLVMIGMDFRYLVNKQPEKIHDERANSHKELSYVPTADIICPADNNLDRGKIQKGDSVECYVQENQSPLEKCVFRVSCGEELMLASLVPWVLKLTSSHTADLMLYIQVDHWHNRAEEGSSKTLSISERSWIWRAQHNAAEGPRESCHYIGYHEEVVPVMIVGRGDVGKSAACQAPKDSRRSNKLWQRLSGSGGEKIPKSHESKPWSYRMLLVNNCPCWLLMI